MQYTDHTPGRTVRTGDKECLFFSGFSYLGLHQHTGFQTLIREGIEKYGLIFPSSRVANLRLNIYEELETAIAALLQQESAAVFSSGYLSSQAAAQFAAQTRQVIYAPDTHPSLWVNNPVLPQTSRDEWVAATIKLINSQPHDTFAIITDTVHPIQGVIHSFKWLQELERKVLVVADDSHGIGVLGPLGQGSIHFLPLSPFLTYLLTASLAKAFSTEGGVVSGPASIIEALKKSPVFSASTSLPPANAHAWLNAKDLFAAQRMQLQQNIAFLIHLLSDCGIHNPFALPIFVLPPINNLAASLLEKNIVISSFPYPLPSSQPVNRAVVSALHSQEDISVLAGSLARVSREVSRKGA